jgi:hypothetical protein
VLEHLAALLWFSASPFWRSMFDLHSKRLASGFFSADRRLDLSRFCATKMLRDARMSPSLGRTVAMGIRGQCPVRAVSDNDEVGSGQIAAPCTFRREGRKPAIRCNLYQGPVSGVNSPTGIPTPSLLTVLNCHWCRTSLRSDTSPC